MHIDTEKLIADVTGELKEVEIAQPRVTVTKARVDVAQGGVFEALQMSGARTMVDLVGRYPLPNLVDIMSDMMAQTTPPVRLTRQTLLEIMRRAPDHCRQAMLANPTEFATTTVRIIKEKLADQLVEGIQYEKVLAWYEMSLFDEDFQTWTDYLVPSRRPNGEEGPSLYDQVPVDSEIERQFVEGLEHREDVRLYVKLPRWFTVPTPIGEYNPDWAIVMEDPEGPEGGKPLLYLVRETKGAMSREGLRPDERRKIVCGQRHFREALGVDYRVIVSANDLP